MTVIKTSVDEDALTLTLVAEFDAAPEKVWEVWADPRKLERWWGPPTWPATFTQYEFTPGGAARYYMTGPDGEKAAGWWRIEAIAEPKRIEFTDGFSGDDGEPTDDFPPGHAVVTFEGDDTSTRMTLVSSFASLDHLTKLIEMGMREGITEAVGQIDALLAE